MAIGDKMMEWAGLCASSLASAVKVVLLSKWRTGVPVAAAGYELVVLGNGPSLNDTLAKHRGFLASRKLLAVNFACNAPVFMEVKPQFYVLADPVFFEETGHDNVEQLWSVMEKSVDWPMTLFAPAKYARSARLKRLAANANISVCFYNLTPVEGFTWVENFAFATGLGMPRPRNVLIPSLMLAVRMRFNRIYIAGADHTWTQTLSVTDDNQVVSIQPHFYKDDDKEAKRQAAVYHKLPLYRILYSFYLAFKSYFVINRWAQKLGVEVINITPGSFIDAFERMKLDKE